MSSGLTRQALRRHRLGLTGPFVTQVVASMVISAMVMTMWSTDAALTPAQRGQEPVATMVDLSQVFLGSSIYLAMLVVGVTMALAMAGQMREVALLRTVGASPGQIRRSAAAQAVAVSLPAALVGFGLSIPAGAAWVALLHDRGLMPVTVSFRIEASVAFPVALGTALVTSALAALIATVRVSRLRPGAALVEVATGRRRVGRIRTVAGVVLLLASLVLSGVLARFDTENAGDASFFVLLSGCIGVGMTGPHLLRAMTHLLGPISGRGVMRAALDDLASMSRVLSGALVPAVLAVAFAVVKVGWHTTAAHIGADDPALDRWTDYAGTTLYCAFAAIAAINCWVTVGASRRRDYAVMQLAGATRSALLRMTGVQAMIFTAVVALVGGGIGAATLVPMLDVTLGTLSPHIPMATVILGLLGIGGVVGIGTLAPIAALTRRSPWEVVAVAA